MLLKIDYDLLAKMHINQLENYLKVRGLKISGSKNELVLRVFPAHGQYKNPHVTSQANVCN